AVAAGYFHWFFLATGGGVPERLIGADPGFWVDTMVRRLLAPGASLEPEVMAEYARCFADPAVIAATCADYRAAAGIDLVHDDADAAAGRVVTGPALVLWGERSFVGREYRPLEVCRDYAADVRGHALPSGHFVPEEAPGPLL